MKNVRGFDLKEKVCGLSRRFVGIEIKQEGEIIMVTKRATKNTKAKAIPKKASAKKANLKTKQRPK